MRLYNPANSRRRNARRVHVLVCEKDGGKSREKKRGEGIRRLSYRATRGKMYAQILLRREQNTLTVTLVARTESFFPSKVKHKTCTCTTQVEASPDNSFIVLLGGFVPRGGIRDATEVLVAGVFRDNTGFRFTHKGTYLQEENNKSFPKYIFRMLIVR